MILKPDPSNLPDVSGENGFILVDNKYDREQFLTAAQLRGVGNRSR